MNDPLKLQPMRVIGQTRPTKVYGSCPGDALIIRMEEAARRKFARKWARKARVQTRPRGWVKQGRDAK